MTDAGPTGPERRAAPRVVALGGGHGLAASLAALRRVTGDLTAVVTVADDGGSSGRLRAEFGVLPPGDLRMALAALCGDDDVGPHCGATSSQHRFAGAGELAGPRGRQPADRRAVGAARRPRRRASTASAGCSARDGRVLPMAAVPLDIEAEVLGARPGRPGERRARSAARSRSRRRPGAWSAVAPGAAGRRRPARRRSRPSRGADWVVLGPGSWFTSVLPHLLVPELRDALVATAGARDRGR